MPLAQGIYRTADLIVQLEIYITTVGLVLAINQCAEPVTVLDLDGRIRTENESVVRILRGRKQSRFILRLPALHARIARFECVAS